MKIGLRIGHSPNCKGAVGIVDEYAVNKELFTRLKSVLESYGNTVIDCSSDKNNQKDDLNYGVTLANNNKVDVFISLHANSTPGGYGTEALVFKIANNNANSIGKRLCENMANLGFRNRGVKVRTDLYDLKYTNMPAVIFEGFFVDSKEDVDRWNSLSWDQVVYNYANAIDTSIPTQKNIREDFNEEWYAKMNPDVVAANWGLYTHYITCGKAEGRSPISTLPKDWNEAYYLLNNPDVNESVSSNNGFINGKTHFLLTGWKEGRKYSIPDILAK